MRLAGLILLYATALFAQFPDGISTSVTRAVHIAPDRADFTAVVIAPLDTTEQQVVQALQDAGISAAFVSGVALGQSSYGYPAPPESQVFYQVSFTVPPGVFKDAARKMEALRAKLPETIAALQYTAYLSASPAAVESAHRAVLPQLLADARTRAQNLAAAAGLKLGAVLGLTESGYGSTPVSAGLFSTPYFNSTSAGTSGATEYTFYASVKYAVE